MSSCAWGGHRSELWRSEATLGSEQRGAWPSFGVGWPQPLLVPSPAGPCTLLRFCLELCRSILGTRWGASSRFALGAFQGPSPPPPLVLGVNQREIGCWSLAKVTRPSGGPSCGNGVRGAALKHGSRKTLMPACNIHSAFDSKAGIVLNSLNISWVAPRRDFGEGFLRCHHIPTLPRSLSCPVWKKSDDTLSCSQRVLQK